MNRREARESQELYIHRNTAFLSGNEHLYFSKSFILGRGDRAIPLEVLVVALETGRRTLPGEAAGGTKDRQDEDVRWRVSS